MRSGDILYADEKLPLDLQDSSEEHLTTRENNDPDAAPQEEPKVESTQESRLF